MLFKMVIRHFYKLLLYMLYKFVMVEFYILLMKCVKYRCTKEVYVNVNKHTFYF